MQLLCTGRVGDSCEKKTIFCKNKLQQNRSFFVRRYFTRKLLVILLAIPRTSMPPALIQERELCISNSSFGDRRRVLEAQANHYNAANPRNRRTCLFIAIRRHSITSWLAQSPPQRCRRLRANRTSPSTIPRSPLAAPPLRSNLLTSKGQ